MPNSLFQALLKTRRLPTPSATAFRILELADQDDADIKEVADAISADPAISARLLKFANAAELGATGEVTSVRQAVTRLGLRAVKVTALSFSLMSDRDSAKCPGFDFDTFWAHSIATAVATRALVPARGKVSADEGFTAGLLSRLGRLVLAVGAPAEYAPVLSVAGSIVNVTANAERTALGFDHSQVGSALMEQWKLPSLLVSAVRHQHDPDAAQDEKSRLLARAVAAGRLAADHLCGAGRTVAGLIALSGQGLSGPTDAAALEGWLEQLQPVFRQTAGVMAISLKELPDAAEIKSRAADLIAELSLVTAAENQTVLAQNRELEERVLRDPLTGVQNRAAFDRHLANELERATRYRRPLSLLMLDVDHFKKFNDSYGHIIGDGVLKLVAQTCAATIRNVDILARYGGEEFGIIAPETTLKQAAVLAERVRQAIATTPYDHPGEPLRVTASIGVATADGEGATTVKSLVKAADAALYEAKRSGRNKCCFAAPQAAAAPAG